MKRLVYLLFSGLVLIARPAVAVGDVAAPESVREPAVAGLFYPRDPKALAQAIDGYLAAAHTESSGPLKALVCPHAGYPYSGPVAGSAFRLLRGTHYGTVIVLGPAHYAALELASVSGADRFRTPLGDVPISPRARALARSAPFALDPPCIVERPSWSTQSSRPEPARGSDRADTWEHSVEVEIPFLQRTLGAFKLIPVVMGDVDPVRAARTLSPYVDDDTLLVVSSDLSHYYSYPEAQRLDRRCVDAICALDEEKMSAQQACGRIPILTLLHLAKQRGWRPQLLDLRNSGDTSGDKSRVVGYSAIAFYGPPKGPAFSTAEQRYLLQLAREALHTSATDGGLPTLSSDRLSPALALPQGVFVTLTEGGELRGCIGHIVAQMPLYRAVLENTRNAALHDPRFPPVTAREVDRIKIEISVLTAPESLSFDSPEDLVGKLQPGRDGVVLRIAAGTATYLPQVWDQLPAKGQFLDSLTVKAGGEPGDWRKPGTKVAIYRVVSFEEPGR